MDPHHKGLPPLFSKWHSIDLIHKQTWLLTGVSITECNIVPSLGEQWLGFRVLVKVNAKVTSRSATSVGANLFQGGSRTYPPHSGQAPKSLSIRAGEKEHKSIYYLFVN